MRRSQSTTRIPILIEAEAADERLKSPNKNAARGKATRLKIIRATIECLYEYGYFGTSTVLVTKAAKVSRGSMLNQFPTKAHLMIAVAEHIAQMRAIAHTAGMEGAANPRARLERLVPILWGELNTPSGVARIELMLAARSDPELADKFEPLNDLLESAHRKVVWTLFESLGFEDARISDAMVHLYAAALRGLSIDLLFRGRERTIENAVILLQSFVQSLLDHKDYHLRAMKKPTITSDRTHVPEKRKPPDPARAVNMRKRDRPTSQTANNRRPPRRS